MQRAILAKASEDSAAAEAAAAAAKAAAADRVSRFTENQSATAAEEKEKAPVGPVLPQRTVYAAKRKAILRRGFEMTSPKVCDCKRDCTCEKLGILKIGEIGFALETRVKDNGTLRVKLERYDPTIPPAWCSATQPGSLGDQTTVVLEEISPELAATAVDGIVASIAALGSPPSPARKKSPGSPKQSGPLPSPPGSPGNAPLDLSSPLKTASPAQKAALAEAGVSSPLMRIAEDSTDASSPQLPARPARPTVSLHKRDSSARRVVSRERF